jgi:hypothetical protein
VTNAERIAQLETLVEVLRDEQRAHILAVKQESEKTNRKLDDLLMLRAKGVGAFWLASTLLGTGIVGMIVSIVEWFKS